METKVATFPLKSLDAKGTGVAVIATLNAVDKDFDVTLPGAFGEQIVPILPAHDWQKAPLGKAKIHESATEVLADLQLNLKTTLGKDWYEALKFDLENPPAKTAWSYGYSAVEAEQGEFKGQRVRFLKKVQAYEVSSVVLGAGINTRTVAMKGRAEAMKGLWLTVDQVKRLCPSCAERMRSKGIRKIALAELAKSLHGEDELELVEAIAHVNEAAADLSEAAWLNDPERRQEAVNNAIAHLERAEERAAAVLDPDAEVESEEGKSFAGYENFDECVAQNQDKEDPEAYCAAIQAQFEGEAAIGKRRRLRAGDGQKTMAEQLAASLADLEALVKRLAEVHDLRTQDGRGFSESRKAEIAKVKALLEQLDGLLRASAASKEAVQRYFELRARTIKGLKLD